MRQHIQHSYIFVLLQVKCRHNGMNEDIRRTKNDKNIFAVLHSCVLFPFSLCFCIFFFISFTNYTQDGFLSFFAQIEIGFHQRTRPGPLNGTSIF